MSQNELHIGKLRHFTKIQGEKEIDTLKRVLDKFGREFNQEKYDYCDGDMSCYLSEVYLYKDVFYVAGDFYINEEHKGLDDLYVNEIEKNSDGSFSYIMGFYNGGTCLSEMIEESLYEYLKK